MKRYIDQEGRREALRQDLARHQIVVLLGARGTGKSALCEAVAADMSSSGVRVLRLDAGEAESIADLNGPLAEALDASEYALTAARLEDGHPVRVVVDNCHRLFDRQWLDTWQEQWRQLLLSSEARGCLSVLLIGRPLFRKISGGNGSPLLNAGVLHVTSPLSCSEIVERHELSEEMARAVFKKTGGHPVLTSRLVADVDGSLSRLAQAAQELAHDRYLMRLIEDHGLAAAGVLADLLESPEGVPEATLIQSHFPSSYAEGDEILSDLAASGLIERSGDRCAILAGLLRVARAARAFVRAPVTRVPTDEPGFHAEAAALLYAAENRLRAVIVDALSVVDPAWWSTRVDGKVAGDAESRRRAESESNVPPDAELHPIMYLTLGELFGIVAREENWRDAFRVRLRRTRPALERCTAEVIAVRNKVSHNRPVTQADMSVLSAALQHLSLSARVHAPSK